MYQNLKTEGFPNYFDIIYNYLNLKVTHLYSLFYMKVVILKNHFLYT